MISAEAERSKVLWPGLDCQETNCQKIVAESDGGDIRYEVSDCRYRTATPFSPTQKSGRSVHRRAFFLGKNPIGHLMRVEADRQNDWENLHSKNSPSFAVALNWGIGSRQQRSRTTRQA